MGAEKGKEREKSSEYGSMVYQRWDQGGFIQVPLVLGCLHHQVRAGTAPGQEHDKVAAGEKLRCWERHL